MSRSHQRSGRSKCRGEGDDATDTPTYTKFLSPLFSPSPALILARLVTSVPPPARKAGVPRRDPERLEQRARQPGAPPRGRGVFGRGARLYESSQ